MTHLLVLRQTQRVVAAVERNELRLEENISVDGQVRGATGLDATEAGCGKDS